MPAPQAIPSTAIQLDPARLVDIQLPQAIGLWPPASGWWVLLLLVIIVLAILVYFISRKKPVKKATVKQLKSQAMIELDNIKTHYDAHPDTAENTHKSVKELSVFLRRYILSLYHRNEVASLTDQQWLQLLDKTYNTHSNKQIETLFTEKYGQLLTQIPYQPESQLIDQLLLEECFDSTQVLIKNSALLFEQDHHV